MIHFPVNAQIECTDGPGGQSTGVIIDPTSQKVTHLVVKEKKSPHTERMVSVDRVVETTSDFIRLRCPKDELATMEPFIKVHSVRAERPCYREGADLYFVMPNFTWPKKVVFTAVQSERIPAGELAVRRGARVEATDGHMGHVHEFLLAAMNKRITHLVLREGYLWGQKELAVPASWIDRLGEKTIYLKRDKHTVESLPASV